MFEYVPFHACLSVQASTMSAPSLGSARRPGVKLFGLCGSFPIYVTRLKQGLRKGSSVLAVLNFPYREQC
jgi:hypothetical protein